MFSFVFLFSFTGFAERLFVFFGSLINSDRHKSSFRFIHCSQPHTLCKG